ncbi:DNA polymerase III subunit delta [Desertifilum sp. FACHB-1129]|uniref:DNA polymerase III subunit delta n=1 Tax=unclassified Desertifilum TaxID=2621682 RepID=UPI0016851C48|nr:MULTISPECIES: DNA polymerase III subunit delta [unclassified Desertifilum]MBD2311256.1 DNA polymerase III subunit delta [Desertifilum sp. FACHB-1129]MBD2324298.1 DNA polymerase III subunit delta [Desertifilum sp. FACHB-866]MBD2334313.1 DNA polymerase III subunit delta [Desertifilum sp. FACHB-868]MDA0213159.1 DNA polymerase III subunit delta [Cyanobacteria bacterium FC1]
MPIELLIGDDRYRIEQRINQHLDSIAPWSELNSHKFEVLSFKSDQLATLLTTQIEPLARTPPLTGGQQLIVVDHITFTASLFGAMQWLNQLPATTILVLTAKSLDKRTKLAKWLMQQATTLNYSQLSPWDTLKIEKFVTTQARANGLRLSSSIIRYLAQAIGTDSYRLATELDKLKLLGDSLNIEQVKQLVPNTNHTALELADAIRTRNAHQLTELLDALQNTHPNPLIATLNTQFRTWLWVKAALEVGTKSDSEIASLCNLSNPKRLYYLKQEVARITLTQLIQVVTRLQQLQVGLKQGKKYFLLTELVDLVA